MSYPGILHQYSYHVAFEFEPTGLPNVMVVIGGLTDGLLTVAYAPLLAKAVAKHGYSVVNIEMASSYKGFGVESLDGDVRYIKKLVDFLKARGRDKIVLCGRSTGSQDVMHYLLRNPETVDAGILNAPVSDRETFTDKINEKTLLRLNEAATQLIKEGKSDQVLSPSHSKCLLGAPINAYRWCSLLLPGGDDDYFSSDLANEVFEDTFGKISRPFLILENEKDEFVPKGVDKANLLKRWEAASNPKFWSKNSGFVNAASHMVVEPEAQQQLVELICKFLVEFGLAASL